VPTCDLRTAELVEFQALIGHRENVRVLVVAQEPVHHSNPRACGAAAGSAS
jgi:hypothetical protein